MNIIPNCKIQKSKLVKIDNKEPAWLRCWRNNELECHIDCAAIQISNSIVKCKALPRPENFGENQIIANIVEE